MITIGGEFLKTGMTLAFSGRRLRTFCVETPSPVASNSSGVLPILWNGVGVFVPENISVQTYLATTGAADQTTTALEWSLETMDSGRTIMKVNRATTAFMLMETGIPNFEDGTVLTNEQGFFFNWKFGTIAVPHYINVSIQGIEYL